MPMHNCSKLVGLSIDSVVSQSYKNWELIIVNDASSDGSDDAVLDYLTHEKRIKLINLERNIGPSQARNTAIQVAQGRFIAFLDSDDIWTPTKLEKQIEFMLNNSYPFTYTAYEKIDEDGKVIGHIGIPDCVSYNQMLKTCYIGCLTAMYDVDFFGKIFMPANTRREDFGTWLRLLKNVDKAYGINEVLAQYRVYDSQSSAKKLNMAVENWKLYRDIENLNLLQAVYYFLNYALRGLLRTKMPNLARKLGVLH